jgi:hypothetical protein
LTPFDPATLVPLPALPPPPNPAVLFFNQQPPPPNNTKDVTPAVIALWVHYRDGSRGTADLAETNALNVYIEEMRNAARKSSRCVLHVFTIVFTVRIAVRAETQPRFDQVDANIAALTQTVGAVSAGLNQVRATTFFSFNLRTRPCS